MPYKNPDKQREFQRKWVHKRRADHFKGKKCARCGKPVSSSTADLDHKKPKRNTTGHKVWSYSKEKRAQKMKGTQILCKSCHKKKSKKDKQKMFSKGDSNESFALLNLGLLLDEARLTPTSLQGARALRGQQKASRTIEEPAIRNQEQERRILSDADYFSQALGASYTSEATPDAIHQSFGHTHIPGDVVSEFKRKYIRDAKDHFDIHMQATGKPPVPARRNLFVLKQIMEMRKIAKQYTPKN